MIRRTSASATGTANRTSTASARCWWTSSERQVQPPKGPVRGQIARAYLYMSQRYGLRLAAQQRKLYEAWDRRYPADRWECERNRRIGKLQGNTNPFIEKQCQ